MNRFLTPDTVIQVLRQDLANFIILPLAVPPQANALTTYFKLRLMVNGAPVPINIVIDDTIVLDYGVANPTNTKDKRNGFVNPASNKKEHNVNFNLRSERLVEMFDLLQDALYAALRRAWDSGNPLYPSKNYGKRPVHTIIDRFKPNYLECTGIVTTPAPDTKPYECPRITLRARLEKRPLDHKVEAWRGTPETVILNNEEPIFKTVGETRQVAGYAPAKVDNVDINWANAYKFLNSGAKFLNTTFQVSDLCYSPSYVSTPLVLTRALVRKGTGAPDDSTDWSKYYVPEQPTETPLNIAAAMPTSTPTPPSTPEAELDINALLGQ